MGTCTDKDIVIPETHEGLPVKEINSFAFHDFTNFTSITIPNSITFIGKSAFGSSHSLTSATFENPDGWWYSLSSDLWNPATSFSNASKNAEYLTDNFCDNYLKRN